MSQHAENSQGKDSSWQSLDKRVPSKEDIDNIYKDIWTDKKNPSGASLTPLERMQYESQNSTGLGLVDNSDARSRDLNEGPRDNRNLEQPRTSPGADRDQPDDNGGGDRQAGRRNALPDYCLDDAQSRANLAAYRASLGAGLSNEPYRGTEGPNYYQRSTTGIGDNCFNNSYGNDPYRHDRRISDFRPRQRFETEHTMPYADLDDLKDLNRSDRRSDYVESKQDDLRSRTQKVEYPDGASRVVLRDERGEITVVVNPDGSRLERQAAVEGEAPSWKAYSRHGAEQVADSFRGQVELDKDGTYRMLKTYPVQQVFEQKANGSYRHAYAGDDGAKEQWTSSEQSKTVIYPTGKARVISFKPDSNGIKRQSAVTDR